MWQAGTVAGDSLWVLALSHLFDELSDDAERLSLHKLRRWAGGNEMLAEIRAWRGCLVGLMAGAVMRVAPGGAGYGVSGGAAFRRGRVLSAA